VVHGFPHAPSVSYTALDLYKGSSLYGVSRKKLLLLSFAGQHYPDTGDALLGMRKSENRDHVSGLKQRRPSVQLLLVIGID
jgi:hypothetical protein